MHYSLKGLRNDHFTPALDSPGVASDRDNPRQNACDHHQHKQDQDRLHKCFLADLDSRSFFYGYLDEMKFVMRELRFVFNRKIGI